MEEEKPKIPERCKRCIKCATYVTADERKDMCSDGKPMVPECTWFVVRPYLNRRHA